MSNKFVGKAYFGLYNPLRDKGIKKDDTPKTDNKAVEDVTKQATENKTAIAEATKATEANKTAISENKQAVQEASQKATSAETKATEAAEKAKEAADKATENKQAIDAVKEDVKKSAEKLMDFLTKEDAETKYATKDELSALSGGITPKDLKALKEAIQLLQDNPDSIDEIAKKANKEDVYDKATIDKKLADLVNDKGQIDEAKLAEKFVSKEELKQVANAFKDLPDLIDMTQYVKKSELDAKVKESVDASTASVVEDKVKEALDTKAEEIKTKAEEKINETKAAIEAKVEEAKAEAQTKIDTVKADAEAAKTQATLNDTRLNNLVDETSKIKTDAAQAKVALETAIAGKADAAETKEELGKKATKESVVQVKTLVDDIVKELAKVSEEAKNKASKEELTNAVNEVEAKADTAKTKADEAFESATAANTKASEANTKADANKVDIDAIKAELVNVLTKAEAAATYQEKGEYVLKTELNDAIGIAPETVQSLKDLASQLEGNKNLSTLVKKLDNVFTKDEVTTALANKVDVSALDEYVEKTALDQAIATKAEKAEVTAAINEVKTALEQNVRDVNGVAQNAKAIAEALEAGIDSANAKVSEVATEVADVKAKLAATGQGLNQSDVQTAIDDTLAAKDYAAKTDVASGLAGKADVSMVTAVDAKVDRVASDLVGKADITALADKLDKTVFDARKSEVDNKLSTLESTTIPALISTEVSNATAGFVTQANADATYQAKGDYALASDIATLTQTVATNKATLEGRLTAAESSINAIDLSDVVRQTELANYAKGTELAEAIGSASDAINELAKQAEAYATKASLDELKTFANTTFATKDELTTASGGGLSQTQVETIVDNKLGNVKDAVQTIANIQSGVNDNKSAVESIIQELAKKATKEEVNSKASEADLIQAQATLNTAIARQENALNAAKTALEKMINDKSDEAAAAYQTKAEFATWITDTYTAALNQIKADMMTAATTDQAIDAKLVANLETLKGLFQVKGNYLTQEDLNKVLKDGYITKTESDRLYQGVGNYSTIEYVDDQIAKSKNSLDSLNTTLTGKLDLAKAQELFQTKGDYVTRGEAGDLATTPAFTNAINSAIQAQSFLDKDTADNLYAAKANYVKQDELDDAIALSSALDTKQDALTFGTGLTYTAATKTLEVNNTAIETRITALENKPSGTMTVDQIKALGFITEADLQPILEAIEELKK